MSDSQPARRGRPRKGNSIADQMPEDGPVLTSRTAAAVMKTSERKVRTLASEGSLPGKRIGTSWRFSHLALLATIAGGPCEIDYEDKVLTAAEASQLLGISKPLLQRCFDGWGSERQKRYSKRAIMLELSVPHPDTQEDAEDGSPEALRVLS